MEPPVATSSTLHSSSPDLTPESSLERDAEKAKFGDKGYGEKTNIRSKSQQVVCGYWQTDSKVYMGRQKAWESQHSIEGQVWRIDTTWRQDLLASYINQDSVISVT